MELFFLKGAAVLLSLVGLLGTVVPAIPGALLIFATAFAYGWATGFQDMTATTLWWLGGLAALAQIIDFAAAAMGVKLSGAGKKAMVGAAIGIVAGMILMGPLGLLIGPFAGAFLAELLSGKDAATSGRAGLAAGAGALVGTLIHAAIAVVMAVWFWIAIF